MTKTSRIFLVVLMMLTSIGLNAQNGINSPYSRYGLGLLSDRSMGFNKGMGGVAQGFRDGQSINLQNPASYSAVDSMTALFDVGLTLQNGNFKMGNVQKNIRNTSFDYFAMQFRAIKNVGVTVGIVPISKIKYDISSSSQKLEGTENITYQNNYTGDGGLREVFLGAAWRPIKPISIGFNAGYVFGDYNHTLTSSFSESGVYSSARVYSANFKTYKLDFGLQYIQPIGKNDKIVIGGSFTPGHNVNATAYRLTETLNSSYIIGLSTDSINNAFQLPTSYAAGITFYKSNKLKIGVDAEVQKWSDCKFPNNQAGENTQNSSNVAYTTQTGQLQDYKKIAFGTEWIPDPMSSHYFSRVAYKFGGFYSQSYAKADLTGTVTDSPTEFGISAGVSLPIFNRWTWRNSHKLNVSVRWTRSDVPYLSTTTMKQAKLTENYLRVCLGLTFSECWFFKWKVQ